MSPKLCIAQDAEADALLSSSPLALLFGMMLDQQIPMEKAFRGPKDISDRMGGLDVRKIAEANPDQFASIVATKPAIHRFPGAMAKRLQSLARYLIEQYDGEADAIWTRDTPNGSEVLTRLKSLPGFGDQKARIFLSLLGKQLEVQPDGWRDAAGQYGDIDAKRSVADVIDADSLIEVRAYKKQAKAKLKAE